MTAAEALARVQAELVSLRSLVNGHGDLDIERRCALTDALDVLDRVARSTLQGCHAEQISGKDGTS